MKARLTTTEAARQLSVTTRTMERWRAQKEGPNYFRIGGRVYYTQAAVDQYLASQTVEHHG